MIPVAKLDTNEVDVTPTNSLLIQKFALETEIGKVQIKEGKEAIQRRAEREKERVTTTDPTVSHWSDLINQWAAGA